MKPLSRSVPSSVTMSLDLTARELSAAGRDIINLTAGQVDLPMPAEGKAAVLAALEADRTGYVPAVGSADLKALEKASNRLFYEMTQEKMTEDILKAKKAKEEEAKKAAQEGGASQETEPAEGEAAPSEEEAKPAENEAAPSEETKPAEESKPADAEPEIDTESSNSTK